MDSRNEGRVYVRRRGRATRGQERALIDLLPRYLIDPPATADDGWGGPWFDRAAPLVIEIGFGMGDALVDFARAHPDWNCVGVDVYRPGIGALLLACERERLGNVRIAEVEALWLLRRLPPASVDRFHVFFPDPWPKKRHHKRRLVNAAFVAETARCLATGGLVALATDWREYAEAMTVVLDAEPLLDGGEAEGAGERPATPFETRGAASGHRITDLLYRRVALAGR